MGAPQSALLDSTLTAALSEGRKPMEAILCEEDDREADVYEDYVHVPNVLAHRGWRHLRVTSRQSHRENPRSVSGVS